MDSMPAQMKAWPAFIWIAPAAMWIDCIDEPQKRLTVVPATLIGRSARKPMMRATLKPCSPSGNAQPMMMSSMSFASTPVRFTSSRTTWPAISSGRTLASWPFFAKWKGERT